MWFGFRLTDAYGFGPKPIITRFTTPEFNGVAASMDSDLEAFSHYPTDGSFAALPFQATALTNYLNKRFLSY